MPRAVPPVHADVHGCAPKARIWRSHVAAVEQPGKTTASCAARVLVRISMRPQGIPTALAPTRESVPLSAPARSPGGIPPSSSALSPAATPPPVSSRPPAAEPSPVRVRSRASARTPIPSRHRRHLRCRNRGARADRRRVAARRALPRASVRFAEASLRTLPRLSPPPSRYAPCIDRAKPDSPTRPWAGSPFRC